MYPTPQVSGSKDKAPGLPKVALPRVCPLCGRSHKTTQKHINKCLACSNSTSAKPPVNRIKAFINGPCPQCFGA